MKMSFYLKIGNRDFQNVILLSLHFPEFQNDILGQNVIFPQNGVLSQNVILPQNLENQGDFQVIRVRDYKF